MASQTKLNNYLLLSAKLGNDEDVQSYIDQGADVRYLKSVCLRVAAMEGHLSTVQLLLKHGADLHGDDDAALREAVLKGRDNVVSYLLDMGADFKSLEKDQQEKYKHLSVEFKEAAKIAEAEKQRNEKDDQRRSRQRRLRNYIRRPH